MGIYRRKQNKNIEKINILFNDIYSNCDIDENLCYCVLSKKFIHDRI
jgi:hypothetical protein